MHKISKLLVVSLLTNHRDQSSISQSPLITNQDSANDQIDECYTKTKLQ